jgi:hypothetical protein
MVFVTESGPLPQSNVTQKRQRMNIVSKTARKEIVAALRARYEKATKLEKGLLFGELTAIAGYHRKHAIRLLSSMMKAPENGPGQPAGLRRGRQDGIDDSLGGG